MTAHHPPQGAPDRRPRGARRRRGRPLALLGSGAGAAPVPEDADGYVIRAGDLSGPVRADGEEQVLRGEVLRAEVDALRVAGRAEVALDVADHTSGGGDEELVVELVLTGDGPDRVVATAPPLTASGMNGVPQPVVVGLDGLDVDLAPGQALDVVIRTADDEGAGRSTWSRWSSCRSTRRGWCACRGSTGSTPRCG